MESGTVRLTPFIWAVITVLALEWVCARVIASESVPPLAAIGFTRLADILVIHRVLSVWGDGFSTIQLSRRTIPAGLYRGLLWSGGFGLVVGMAMALLALFGYQPLKLIRTGLPRNPADLVLFYLVGGLVAPVAEEIFFRGMLYGFFRRWGKVLALFASTLAFAALHGSGGHIPFTQVIGGLLFAWAYEIEGNLMVPMVIHALGNLAIFTLSLL